MNKNTESIDKINHLFVNYLFDIASQWYSQLGRGVLLFSLDDNFGKSFIEKNQINTRFFRNFLESSCIYIGSELIRNQRNFVFKAYLQDYPTFDEASEIIAEKVNIDNYNPSINASICISFEKSNVKKISLNENSFFCKREGLYFFTISRKKIVSKELCLYTSID